MQRILVVEDDLDIQELLKNFLLEVGYEIILAKLPPVRPDRKSCVKADKRWSRKEEQIRG